MPKRGHQLRGFVRRLTALRPSACALGLALASGCEPTLIVGKWSGPAAGEGGSGGAGGGGSGGAGVSGLAGSTSGAGGTGGAGGSGGVEGGAAGDAGAGGDSGAGAGTDAGAGGEGACDPTLMPDAPGGAPSDPAPVEVPWSTGFENGFCDYAQKQGFCYTNGDARFAAVSSPAHDGVGAAEFFVNATTGEAAARCVRQGLFPPDAVYGAWFYVSTAAERTDNWNLMYFNGRPPGGDLIGFWDVSIHVVDGRNVLVVFDQRRGMRLVPEGGPDVPIGSWFHVEFRLRRSAEENGLIELRQDGMPIFTLDGIVTDTSEWAQWYIGNLVAGRTPPDSTLYVDDVSITLAR